MQETNDFSCYHIILTGLIYLTRIILCGCSQRVQITFSMGLIRGEFLTDHILQFCYTQLFLKWAGQQVFVLQLTTRLNAMDTEIMSLDYGDRHTDWIKVHALRQHFD